MKTLVFGIVMSILGVLGFAHVASAVGLPPSDFSLQVSPSPLVTTLKPGTDTTLELKIRNMGSGTEELKIATSKFTVDKNTGEVKLDDSSPSEIAQWVRFEFPTFTVKKGEWFTQKIHIALPKNTGFSYSLALVVSRVAVQETTEPTRVIKGSVAVFTLINVDRPGATRKLEVDKFSTSAGVYEYLPATITMNFKNTGNTIVQPYGNVFIQNSSSDTTPIATLPVNDKKGYILPESTRTLTTQWTEGFPSYKISKNADGSEKKEEIWDWSQVSKFRMGIYTAKLVAVYNDGQRDIPIQQEVTFWVFPWKIIFGLLIIVVILTFGLWSIIRKVLSLFRRSKRKPTKQE
ncbi:MAG: hypothetical protein WAW80_02635 [Candidatus Saccharimonadales bacterium]